MSGSLDCGLRIADFGFVWSPRLPVSRSHALRLGQYAERDVLQYAIANNQQAFIAELSRHRTEDHLAQFSGGPIELGFLPGFPRMFLLERFSVRRQVG